MGVFGLVGCFLTMRSDAAGFGDLLIGGLCLVPWEDVVFDEDAGEVGCRWSKIGIVDQPLRLGDG